MISTRENVYEALFEKFNAMVGAPITTTESKREAIYEALFAKFSSLVGAAIIMTENGVAIMTEDDVDLEADGVVSITTASRRWKPWSDVGPEMQPALYQMQVRETAIVQNRGIPTKYKLDVDLYIYATQQDENEPFSTTLNAILDAIDAKLVPDDPVNNECTLGGLVQRCRITGAVEIFEGVNDGRQIVAVLPIEILTV